MAVFVILLFIFKKNISCNRCYETCKEFKQACQDFLAKTGEHLPPFRSLLAANFRIIDGKKEYS